MKRFLTPGLAMLAGVAFGAIAAHGLHAQALHAQASPPAYVITELDMADKEAFLKDYAPLIAPTFQPFGGRYIVRGGNTVSFDGSAPKRIVVTAFDSMEKAQAWRASDAYKNLIPMLDQVVTSVRSYAVEGTTQ